MKFAEILKNLLIEHDLSQAQLAKSIGYTQRAVSKWICNQSEPTESAILAVSKYFEVSTDYLLGRADELGNATVQSSAPALPADERELLTLYRSMSNPQKRMFAAYGEGLTEPLASNKKRS